MSLVELAEAVFLALGILGLIAALARFVGGRWRSVAEANAAQAAAEKATVAARDATIKEMEKAQTASDERIAAMGERMAQMDEERKQFMGSDAYAALIENLAQMTMLLKELREDQRRHEEAAQLRARQMLGMIETVGTELLERCGNGGGQ